ncbi:hypothetical protein [Dokdonella soli]|uniref:Phage tail protein n=1 Tax=Dokdonella soli TaxID=529810 RepID=A0ABN1IU26_9GAMM
MAANKYLSLGGTGLPVEVAATQVSAGGANANQVVALNSSGFLDSTLFPAGFGESSISVVTSENLAAGALVNLYNNAGVLTARNANATDATKPAMGFVTAASTSPAANTVFFAGQQITGLSGLTIGAYHFLSASTAGTATATVPAATGNLAQNIGYALSATILMFLPQIGITRA